VSVRAGEAEVLAPMPGDGLVIAPDAVMDRAFTLPATPEQVWPWIVQLGKDRSGWYLPHRVERFLPRSHRALRSVSEPLQHLRVGDVIPDWGKDATFTVAELHAPAVVVFSSQRGRAAVSWSIFLTPVGTDSTRVRLRLRLGPIRHKWLAATAGDLLDLATIAGLAAGLRERVARS
jgi:hypothetical protein